MKGLNLGGDRHEITGQDYLRSRRDGGKACVRGMRVTAGTVVGLLAADRSRAEILQAYPYLEEEDIDQCLAYAAWRLEEREVPLYVP